MILQWYRRFKTDNMPDCTQRWDPVPEGFILSNKYLRDNFNSTYDFYKAVKMAKINNTTLHTPYAEYLYTARIKDGKLLPTI